MGIWHSRVTQEEDDIADQHDQMNVQKDPEERVTGDEPMTGAQASYPNALAAEAGDEAPERLTKAEASETLDELQPKTGPGSAG